ncbi:MAG TPA: hypothetical protein PKE29_17320 [Phycisphaerales bacterium]|nr:hypothetical protein [Phycisphaerales bacterium]
MNRTTLILTALTSTLLALGCEQKPAQSTATPTPAPAKAASAFPDSLFLATAPAEPKSVKDAKAAPKVGEKITLTGRIGGSEDPFIEGRALFTIVDLHVPHCGQMGEKDHCKTPWDYCCEPADELAAHTATIQVTAQDGRPIKSGLSGVHGLKPLAIVTITGTIADAAEGNLIVRAEGIHVAQ